MRSLITLAVAAIGVALPASSASGQAPPPVGIEIDIKAQAGDPSVVYDVVGTDGSTTKDGAESTRRGAGARSRPPRVFVTFPILVDQPDGTRCLSVQRRAFPDPVSAGAATDAQNVLWRIAAASYPLCPRTPRPEAPTPAQEAAEFWRVAGEDLLPRPEPRIAPGYMLAGKTAYLEAGTAPTARFAHPTPIGLLTIDATSQIYVDWGDGSGPDGPYRHAGGPWPSGTITHYWTHAATYDVRVVQRWVGTWRLGDQAGDLAGLRTEGVLEDFEVRDLQAVRNF